VIVNIDGCRATDTVTVKNDCYMSIPNVFTPNNDGLNDYFFPRQYLTSGLTSFSMSIYNRWGQLVFSSTTLDGRGWDGKFNGVDQIEGVYVYIIDATFRDGQKEHHQGNVTLLR
jgi:gliding motility-associated-like protein